LDVSLSSTDSSSQAFHIWREALEHTRSLSPASFEQWFASVQFDGFENGILALVARDEFVRDWVKTHFQPTLVKRIRELTGIDSPDSVRIEWRISSNLANPVCPGRDARSGPRSRPPVAVAPVPRPPGRFLHGDSLNAKHTFPNFVVGPSNELAYAAACASAGEGGPRYNPLFLCGGTGLGKTHLMHAIAHRVLEKKPDARVVYVSAERFTNEFIEALQHHKMDEFRARYRSSCDLLLLDDIQFLAGREQTQEEFFHTFNALRDADKPIIVSSDKYPQDLARMPERLISRFTSGLVADVHVPELETRVAIVRKKAHLEGIALGDDIAVLLAQRIKTNVRELEGTLIRLAAKASLTGRSIDYDFASSEISMISPTKAETTSVEDIQRAVCGHFRLSNSELLSKDRHKSVAFARHVAMYLCRQRLGCSFPELGRAFGNRDHTTVISAVRRVEQLRQKDPQVNAHLAAIEQKLAAAD